MKKPSAGLRTAAMLAAGLFFVIIHRSYMEDPASPNATPPAILAAAKKSLVVFGMMLATSVLGLATVVDPDDGKKND